MWTAYQTNRRAPNQNVIVAEHAAVGRGGFQAVGIFGAHAIIDALACIVLAAGDARFEIDDAGIRLHASKLVERSAPDVVRINTPVDRAICALGKAHIIHRRLHIILVQIGLAEAWQDLVDVAAGHHVPAQE